MGVAFQVDLLEVAKHLPLYSKLLTESLCNYDKQLVDAVRREVITLNRDIHSSEGCSIFPQNATEEKEIFLNNILSRMKFLDSLAIKLVDTSKATFEDMFINLDTIFQISLWQPEQAPFRFLTIQVNQSEREEFLMEAYQILRTIKDIQTNLFDCEAFHNWEKHLKEVLRHVPAAEYQAIKQAYERFIQEINS